MNKLSETIAKVLHHLKIEELNTMQKASLNPEISEKDVILLSPTGTGKTLAFLLPLIEQLVVSNSGIQAFILAPSRELALQIDSVFKSMNTTWKSYCCYGGHAVSEEKKALQNNNPAIIIGTPGRISDHLRRGNITPNTIHTLIIDEFDKSLELGFEEEMAEIIAQLSNLKKRILISATDMEEVPAFTGLAMPVKLNFLSDTEEERLRFLKVISPDKDKINTLFRLLCSLGNQQSIVFCNHRDSVERVYKMLAEKKIWCEIYHGGMEQADRERALMKFRNGSSRTLISTDLASRGLDIPEIENIIHYHLPVNEEAFTHRNGRSTRWDTTGHCFLIMHESELIPSYIPSDLDEYLLPSQLVIPSAPAWITLYIGKGKKDKLNKMDIVGFICKKGMLSNDDLGLVVVKEHQAFVAVKRNKVKQLLSLIAGEKIKGMKTIIKEIR